MNMARSPGDKTIGVSSQYLSMVSSLIRRLPAPSEFESMVMLSDELPRKDEDLISVLLASAHPGNDGGCEVLRPLWEHEAIHRVHGFMRLIGARSRRGSLTRQNPIDAGMEDFAARDLAAQFRELETGAERAILPCSTILWDVINDLGALFGCPAGIKIRTKIERVSLPGYKRRALVLAACKLFCNALLHAFPGHATGLIEIGLTFRGPRSVCLQVADNGIGFGDVSPNLTCGVAAGLADLLEADLAYTRAAGRTIAEIVFPNQRS